ncbi:MAG TPA: threonylcarbamoyl-AMP synthase [Lachnospiraceae bacterium]|nr:threonylcarbamoyl-AMP synthase [Lachnospiraceae bacterium]
MITKIHKVDVLHPDPGIIKEAGEVIKKGGLVAFPTETVYGLGGDALDPGAAQRIYAAKGRPSDNPLIVHICETGALKELAAHIPDKAAILCERFWPGPLTMIFRKRPVVPDETTGGLDTVAVRMPDNRAALEFIRAAGGFIAAPSANLSGRPSPTTAERVLEDMDGRIELILDGGSSVIGLESTIVDLTSDTPLILRPGYVTEGMLKEAVGEALYDPAVFQKPSADTRPRAPGMKYRHYAPEGELKIIKGEEERVISYIRKRCEELKNSGKKAAVIASEDTFSRYDAFRVINIGKRSDEEAIAGGLYESLRQCDDEGVEFIFSEEFMTPRLGTAIMNRLTKAAGYEVIEV